MKRKLFRPEFLVLLLGGVAAQGQVINMSDYDNFATYNNGWVQYNPYVGPGAYAGAGANDFWNGFGIESDGNHPYPSTGFLSDSTGTPTGVGYSINYDFNNGGLGNWLSGSGGVYVNTLQGTPGFLFGQAALVTGSDVGTLTLTGVSGTYDLYLYGANYDGTRGAQFTVNSGTAVGGISATKNPYSSGGSGPLTTFVLGVDYVEFTGVTPDGNGNISITWAQNPLDNSGGGEGDFNGISLVAVPEPASFCFVGMGIAGLLAARRRK